MSRSAPKPTSIPNSDQQRSAPRALVLEDDGFDAAVTRELLEKFCTRKYQVTVASSVQESIRHLSREVFSVALVDMNVIDSKGLETVQDIVRSSSDTPIVVLTGDEDIDTATEALRLGAQDYIPKSQLDNRTLQRTIEYAIQRKAKETELTMRAYYDGLTGLANRAHLYERWNRSLARTERSGKDAGLMIADLDRFKTINDHYGHDAGDDLLKHFASVLLDSVRESDVVARLGGDEFIVVLESLQNKDELDRVRQAIFDNIGGGFNYRGQVIPYTVSIGGTLTSPKDQEDLLAVIKRADIEMYEFKASSRVAAKKIDN
ncbi:diguanylate cyclase [Parvularcula bermudensis]|nr:diguanylate cyclase [Parvularcula bermudensis]